MNNHLFTLAAILIAAGLVIGAWNYIQSDSSDFDGIGSSAADDQEFYTRADLDRIVAKPGEVNLYYVWMRGCPACAAQDRWLKDMADKYPTLNVYKFNIQTEARLLEELARAYEVPTTARGTVPANFIGDDYFIGFDAQGMETKIKECLIETCPDPGEKLRH